MARHCAKKALLTLTIISVLASCSSDDDEPATTTPNPMTDTGDMSGSSDGGTDGTPMNPVLDLATTPVFMTTTCDAALPPEQTASSSIALAPAQMLPDTLVSGFLDPDSTDNAEHYWLVNLDAGIYHLILESRISSGGTDNIGLMVESTNASGGSPERLIRSNEVDYRVRDLNTLTLESAQTLRLKVTPLFGQEDYLMGIFRNGTPVASPRFDNCPQISALSLDTTEAFTLETFGDSGVNEVWFQSTFEVADYTLATSASTVSGESTNIAYFGRTSDQFGQLARQENVVEPNEVASMLNSSGTFQPADPGPYWIRFRNTRESVNLSVTLTQD